MARILVLFATQHGQSARIADRIAHTLRERGHDVDVERCTSTTADTLPQGYDGIVLGSSVHRRRHLPAVHRFVRRHVSELDRVPSAFFSVSMAGGNPDPRARAEAERYVGDLTRRTGWRPSHVGLFAGALVYSQYGPVTRAAMRTISRITGGPTDTTHDYDYTSWTEVDRFAGAFADRVQERVVGQPVVHAE